MCCCATLRRAQCSDIGYVSEGRSEYIEGRHVCSRLALRLGLCTYTCKSQTIRTIQDLYTSSVQSIEWLTISCRVFCIWISLFTLHPTRMFRIPITIYYVKEFYLFANVIAQWNITSSFISISCDCRLLLFFFLIIIPKSIFITISYDFLFAALARFYRSYRDIYNFVC